MLTFNYMNLNSNKILGVDPGTNILGYAILNSENKTLKIDCMGVIKLAKLNSHQEKLKEIFLQLQEIIETYLPAHLAIEAPFYGKNVQSMLKLGRAQGVAMAAGMTMGLNITEYSPKKIKQSVCGNGNASKEQVSSMLGHLLNVKLVDEYLDSTDALGAAMCHYNQSRSIGGAGKKYSSWSSFLKNNPAKLSKKQ